MRFVFTNISFVTAMIILKDKKSLLSIETEDPVLKVVKVVKRVVNMNLVHILHSGDVQLLHSSWMRILPSGCLGENISFRPG